MRKLFAWILERKKCFSKAIEQKSRRYFGISQGPLVGALLARVKKKEVG